MENPMNYLRSKLNTLAGITTAAAAFTLLMTAPALSAQSTKAATKSTAKGKAATQTAAPSNGSPGIPPKEAVLLPNGERRYTDAQGKTWLYRETPFGWVRSTEEDAVAAPSTLPMDVTIVDKGDEVEFSRYTPFGPSRWTKKKSELDAMERALVDRAAADKK
jgi:hypothetical protein